MQKTVFITVSITIMVLFILMLLSFFIVNGFNLDIGKTAVIKKIYEHMQLAEFTDGYHAIGFCITSYMRYLAITVFELVGGALVLLLGSFGVYKIIRKKKTNISA
jgi:hypothetical protein